MNESRDQLLTPAESASLVQPVSDGRADGAHVVCDHREVISTTIDSEHCMAGTATAVDSLFRTDSARPDCIAFVWGVCGAGGGFTVAGEFADRNVGITKTLVGYFAASVSMRFNVDNPVDTAGAVFFLLHFSCVFVLGDAACFVGTDGAVGPAAKRSFTARSMPRWRCRYI